MFLLLAASLAAAAPATVSTTARSGVTMSTLRASKEDLLVASFTYEEISWDVKCKAVFKPDDNPKTRELTCTARSSSSTRSSTSVSYIGETEKNLSIRFGKSGGSAAFMVEISGVNAG